MAKRDLKVLNAHLYGQREYDVDDRTSSSASATHKPGEPVKKNGNFALLCATGDPEIGTDTLLGIVAKESTETSSADGKCEVIVVGPGSVIRGKPTTTANMDTASELQGLLLDYVAFDLTSTTFTIDENEGDDPNVHGLQIISGNVTKLTLDVMPHVNVTQFGPLTGQTMD
jgi:hypothetical protein